MPTPGLRRHTSSASSPGGKGWLFSRTGVSFFQISSPLDFCLCFFSSFLCFPRFFLYFIPSFLRFSQNSPAFFLYLLYFVPSCLASFISSYPRFPPFLSFLSLLLLDAPTVYFFNLRFFWGITTYPTAKLPKNIW